MAALTAWALCTGHHADTRAAAVAGAAFLPSVMVSVMANNNGCPIHKHRQRLDTVLFLLAGV